MDKLAILVPVRNGVEYLSLFLEQAGKYASTVIALDDGSTDETRAMLEASPVVTHLLTNPVRPTFAGWDDLANRNALLQRLTDLNYVGWVLFLDADELLDERDAQLLCRTIAAGSLDERTAYGLRVYRMVHDLERFYKEPFVAYRLFHFSPGYRIEGGRLHFYPIPSELPRERWRPTNLRIKHRSSLTPELRQIRFSKYVEADPGNEFQPSYQNLIDDPVVVRSWAETDFASFFPAELPR